MRAAFRYRPPECEPGGGRLADGEKIAASVLDSSLGTQGTGATTDKSALGRNGQVQAQSALKVLQHQLESFQALRHQTLQNVSMVQSEINEILNKNIADMKRPEFNSDPLLLTSRPLSVTMPRWSQEGSLLKNQLHLDKKTMQCPETNPSKIFGDSVTGGNLPHHILSKCQSAGKAEASVHTPREKAILAFKNGHDLKNSASITFSPSWVGLETETRPPLSEIKDYVGSEASMAFHVAKDEHVTENASPSFRNMKQDNKKTPRHELSYAFDVQNTSTVFCGKDNDSGFLSEQNPAEKETSMSSEDFQSRRTSEDAIDRLHTAVVSFKEDDQITAQLVHASNNQNKEFFAEGNMFEKFQLKILPKTGEEKSVILERKKDKQLQAIGTKQEFQKHKDPEFCDVGAGSDNYGKTSRLLQMSSKEPEPLQKKVDLQSENVDVKMEMKPLTAIIQSLTEQNSKYQKQIKDLHDEKSSMQERLVKSDRDCKECIKEVKKLLKKCKELQQQKSTLEGKQDELYAQNQRLLQNLDNFQKKEEQTLECLAALTREKGDLVIAVETLENQIPPLQEERKGLERKVSHLTEEKSLLEKELEEKQKEIQQLKGNEKTKQSEMDSALRMVQSLKEEKLHLEKVLQELTDSKEGLQKELEEAQRERANAEEKLLAECKNTRMETGILKTNLSNMEREHERLSAVVGGLTEDNRVLKKELNEYKQEVSECKATIRELREELLLMENDARTMENEKDALQFEVSRLHRNNSGLRDQVTALFDERYKPRYNSRSKMPDPANAAEICEEMSSFEHISVKYNSPGNSRQTTTPSRKDGMVIWDNFSQVATDGSPVGFSRQQMNKAGLPLPTSAEQTGPSLVVTHPILTRANLALLLRLDYPDYPVPSRSWNLTKLCRARPNKLNKRGSIAELRRKLEEGDHHKEEKPSNTRQHYSTVSFSCTTSVIRELGFHTAIQKKYCTLCSAT